MFFITSLNRRILQSFEILVAIVHVKSVVIEFALCNEKYTPGPAAQRILCVPARRVKPVSALPRKDVDEPVATDDL